MNMDDLEEKFTRCPQCRSYSIASTPSKIRSPLLARFLKSYNHYHCRNCGLDFKQLTNQDLSLITRELHAGPWKKSIPFIILTALAIVIFITIFFLFFQIDDEKTDETTRERPRLNQISPPPIHDPSQDISDQTPQNSLASDTPHDTESQGLPDSKSLPVIEPEPVAGTIDLMGKSRYGVNWRNEGQSLLITRLSEGPLFNAGLKIGDKITHLNAQPVVTEAILLDFRNKLNNGILQEGIIQIDRSGETLFFKIISTQTPSKDNLPPNKNLLLFQETQLKIRNSAPHEESSSHRWVYNSKTITISRKTGEKIFLSGHPDNPSPWAVDNIILISKSALPGLKSPVSEAMPIIPKNLYREALDITDYFPADAAVQITFSLVDLGIKWGNSNIFLVFQ